MAEKINWYPVRVFFGRAELVKSALVEADIEFFYPTRLVEKIGSGGFDYVQEPLIRSLLFIRCERQALSDVKAKFGGTLIPYYDKAASGPLVVPDVQMEQFIKVCGLKDAGLEYLGDDDAKYHKGDRVRVTDGIFKGLEGHIKRIRHDRKLVVTIEGVAAFATSYIPPAFLEKIEENK